MNKRKVPTKNYIVLGAIYLVIILIVVYISNWYRQSDFNDNNSITTVVSEIKIEEFTSYIQENPDVIIYFGNAVNSDTKLQQKIGSYILKKNLTDNVVYINTYSISQKWINDINSQYLNDELKINGTLKLSDSADNIVAFKDGKIIGYAVNSTQILTYDDAKEFLNRYGVLIND